MGEVGVGGSSGTVKVTFLGTGTSFGIPVVGCDCSTCTSADPHDKRSQHGAVVTFDDGARLLVDTPPELRLQLVQNSIDRVDAVWYTHLHADHVHGIDDLRAFTVRGAPPFPAYVPHGEQASLEQRFAYIFDQSIQPPRGTSKPTIELHGIRPDEPVEILGRSFMPVTVPHGPVTVYGFRVGPLGYVTDGKRLPDAALATLRGVRVLVLNALWFGNPHPTHFNVEEAVEAARVVGAERTFLTHLTHRVRHEELAARLPPGVEAAFDGLTVELDEEER